MPLRWFVEVSPLASSAVRERYCVEAPQWQAALTAARKLRQEEGPLSRFTIDVTDTGYRAVDPEVRLRYEIARAPDDAVLTEPADVAPRPTTRDEPMSVTRALGADVDVRADPPAHREEGPLEPPPTLVGTRLVHSRAEEPSDAVPIAYREYAYAVAPWSTEEELRTLLGELFQRAARALADRPQGKYIQLALFDHVFGERPERPPLATLAWKDWRGEPVVTVSSPGSAPAPPPAEASPLPRAQPEPAPKNDEPPESAPPPSHAERRRRGPDDDLITELFDRMGELHFIDDLVDGVEHVLVALWELIPCEGTLIHVCDPDRGDFVVVRAAGPHPDRALLHRTPASAPLLKEAFTSDGVVRIDSAADARLQGERWAKLGVEPERALCGGVQHGGRPLAAIELANPITSLPFYESEQNALAYVCEQLADFVENRPVVINDAIVTPRA